MQDNTVHHACAGSLPRDAAVTIGRYLVSPLIRKIGDSLYAASVSVRSGRGSGTSDWILRFAQPFACPDSAGRYATEQGLNWVRDRSVVA
ncbi:MAG: hypothetical protein PGN26_09965 [Xylophilus ampelinus]